MRQIKKIVFELSLTFIALIVLSLVCVFAVGCWFIWEAIWKIVFGF